MNKIDHEELFGNVKNFLKSKGIDLQDGTYTQRIHQGCGVLAESINLGQKAWTSAKTTVDEKLGQLRQTIHERTAPKPPASASAQPVNPTPAAAESKAPRGKKTARRPASKKRKSK